MVFPEYRTNGELTVTGTINIVDLLEYLFSNIISPLGYSRYKSDGTSFIDVFYAKWSERGIDYTNQTGYITEFDYTESNLWIIPTFYICMPYGTTTLPNLNSGGWYRTGFYWKKGDKYFDFIALLDSGAGVVSNGYIGEYRTTDYTNYRLSGINGVIAPTTYPITYRLTNCTAPTAPTEAAVGDTVTVPLTFPSGYGVANTSNAYVMNNGVLVPSTYSNGTLTFTMPDPSQSS